MAYEKQNFVNNYTILNAEHLTHMEDGIYQNSVIIAEHNTQMKQLSEDIDLVRNTMLDNARVYTIDGAECEFGSLNLTTGEVATSKLYVMKKDKSPFKLLSNNVVVTVASGYMIRGCVYDEYHNFIEFFNWVTGTKTPIAFQNRVNGYVNFYIGKSDNTAPDISTIPSNVVEIRCEFPESGFDRKVIVNLGDSIFGKRRPPDDISTELARLTGAAVYNCGFGGCRMAQHSLPNYDAFSMYQLADAVVSGDWSYQDAGIAETTEKVPSYFAEGLAILKGLDFSTVDIVTISYGTNDFTGGVKLDNTNNAYDTTTFSGALRHSVEALLTAYPNLKIFVCSPVYRFWMDSNGVFTGDSDTVTMGGGVLLTEFVDKTEELAKEYHLPYINNYDIGMNKHNRSYYFSATDGTHPLNTGCKLIAANMANKLF